VREDRVASVLPLGPQTALRIETRTADVRLVPSPDDTVRVLTVKRVQSMSERSVDALWSQIKVTVERKGSDLILRVREPERGTSHVTVEAGPWRLRRRIEVELTIGVPAGKPVYVLTERGDIEAHDLKQQALTLDLYSGDAHVYDGCHVGACRLGHALTQAKCFEMARDLYLFPCRERGIENGIHRKMLLAPRKPRCCVIKPHDGEQTQCRPVDASLERLARSALQHRELRSHTRAYAKRMLSQSSGWRSSTPVRTVCLTSGR